MGSDDRIRFLAREEIQLAMAQVVLEPGELTEGEGWADRLDDLHREIHVLATQVSALEIKLNGLVSSSIRTPARKTAGEPKGSA